MISANSTIMLIVTPKEPMSRMPIRNEPGIATPTSNAVRMPSMPMMTMNTSSTAASTLFCSSVSMSFTSFDLSRDAMTSISAGQ